MKAKRFPKIQMSFSLPISLYIKLYDYSEKSKLPMSKIINLALYEYLEKNDGKPIATNNLDISVDEIANVVKKEEKNEALS